MELEFFGVDFGEVWLEMVWDVVVVIELWWEEVGSGWDIMGGVGICDFGMRDFVGRSIGVMKGFSIMILGMLGNFVMFGSEWGIRGELEDIDVELMVFSWVCKFFCFFRLLLESELFGGVILWIFCLCFLR